MLFDLEDYKNAGIIGVARKSVENVYWGDSYTTWRATHDAYRKAVNEWFLASNVMAPAEDKQQLMVNFISIMDKFTESGRKGKIFFNALMSKSITAEIASTNGITEGTSLRIFSVSQGESWYNEFIDLPNLEYPTAWNWNNSKYVLFIGEDSPNGYSELQWRGEKFVYTTMTQAIYDDHKNAMIGLQAKIKETYLLIEGISDIPEWIEPEVPAWNDSAELSGYVRDSRSLPISGVTVRLVDADGVNHDLVTDDLGYYRFTKEYIYNNISFGTASSAEFDMFILEETLSGTVLYNTTNILQNSFFGAVNNRDLVWPVLVKSGKQNRRNFKIEFIPDYSAYPSLSGHVYDQDGNPAPNALVELKYKFAGYANYSDNESTEFVNIGDTYNSLTQKWSRTTKFKLFGEDKSILTDENGFYEYPSQMIGEWFNNNYKVALIQTGIDSSNDFFNKALVYNPYAPAVGFHIDGTFNNVDDTLSTSVAQGIRVAGGQMFNWPIAEVTGVQSDGKVLMGGDIWTYNGENIPQNRYSDGDTATSGIIRLNLDGSLDSTFNPDLYRINEWNNFTAYPSCIDVLSNDKILLSGNFCGVAGATAHGLVLLNSDGSLDTIFYPDAELISTFENNGNDHQFTHAKALLDGKVIAQSENRSSNLYVFNADGTLNGILDSYGNNSSDFLKITISYTPSGFSTPKLIKVDEDGSFFLAGSFFMHSIGSDGQPTGYIAENLAKFNADGTMDETFKFRTSTGYYEGNIGVLAESGNGGYTAGGIIKMIKEESGSYLVSGIFESYISVDIDRNLIAEPVRNFIRISETGELLDKMIGATDVSLDEVGFEYGIAYPMNNLEIIDTSLGKKIVGFVKGNGNIVVIDYATGQYDTQRLKLGIWDGYSCAMVKAGNDLVFTGRFTKYTELGKNSDGTSTNDRFNNKYFADDYLGGILKLKFGNFSYIEPKFTWMFDLNPYNLGWSQTLRNPNNVVSSYNHNFTINDVKVVLNPWVQDSLSGSVYNGYDKDNQNKPEPTKIYNYQDWFNSRFGYAFNDRGEEYAIELHGGVGKDKILDIHEALTDAEYGAEKVYFTGYHNNGEVILKTTTGYARLRKPDGTFQIFGYGNTDDTFTISYSQETTAGNSEGLDYYFYSCEGEHGAADGKITGIYLFSGDYNNYIDIDITRLTQLESINIQQGRLRYLDLRQNQSLKNLTISATQLLKIDGLESLPNLENYSLDGPVYSYTTDSNIDYQYTIDSDESYAHRVYWTPGAMNYINGERVEGAIELESGKFMMYGNFGAYTKRDVIGREYSNFVSRGIMRLNSDGSVDESFTVEAGFNGRVNGVVELPDNKLLVSGDFQMFKDEWILSERGCLVRLTESGNLDRSFPRVIDSAGDVICSQLLPDGRILVTGRFYLTSNGQTCSAVIINTNGTVHRILPGIEQGSSFIQNAKILSDGKLLIYNSWDSVIRKYDSNYNLISDFETSIHLPECGPTMMTIDSNDNFYLISGNDYSVTIDGVEETILHGSVLRFNSDGLFDNSFYQNTKLISFENWNGQRLNPGYLQVLSNGNVVVNGYFQKVNGENTSGTFVLNNDGTEIIGENGLSISGKIIQTTNWSDYQSVLSQVFEIGDDLLLLGGQNLGQFIGGNIYEYWSGIMTKVYKRPYRTYKVKDIRSLFITGSYENWSWFKGDLDYTGLPNVTELNIGISPTTTSINLQGLTKITNLSIYGDINFYIDLSNLSLLERININGFVNSEITFAQSLPNLTQVYGNAEVLKSIIDRAPILEQVSIDKQISGDIILPSTLKGFHVYSNVNLSGSTYELQSFDSIDISGCEQIAFQLRDSVGTTIISDELTKFSYYFRLEDCVDITMSDVLNKNAFCEVHIVATNRNYQWLPVFAGGNKNLVINTGITNSANNTRAGRIFMFRPNISDLTIDGNAGEIWIRDMKDLSNLTISSYAHSMNFDGCNNLQTFNLTNSNADTFFGFSLGRQMQDNGSHNSIVPISIGFTTIDLSSFYDLDEITIATEGQDVNLSPILPSSNVLRYVNLYFYNTSSSFSFSIDSILTKLVQNGATNGNIGARPCTISSIGTAAKSTLLSRGWNYQVRNYSGQII